MNTAEPREDRVAVDVSAIPPGRGGAGTYVRSLVASLPGAGIEPTLLASKNSTQWPDPPSTVLRLVPPRRLQRLAWEQSSMHGAIARSAPGVRLLHSPHYTMPMRRRRGVGQVVTVHDATFFTRPQSHSTAKRLLFRRATLHALRNADAVIAVSERTAAVLRTLAEPVGELVVIPHGVDHRCYSADTKPDDRARLERLGVNGPFTVHVGTIEPRKNVARLIEAFTEVRREFPDHELVLVGSMWEVSKATIPDLIARSPGVRWLGPVPSNDDVAALYRAAGAVAYPSVEEGFGLPVLEAMACGAHVVTSADSVMSDVGADTVITVDPTDVAAIADGLLSALHRNGRAVRAVDVASSYTWAASAHAHAALYRTLLGP